MSFGTDTSEQSEFLRGIEVGKKSLTTQELIDELVRRDGVIITSSDLGSFVGSPATIIVVRK